ncbi:unnamed protein product, partial [Mesorhabditis spiculigera]
MDACSVCRSEKHTGVYYGAFVCSGCKVFFMRTVVAGIGFVCHAGGICANPQVVGIRANRRYNDTGAGALGDANSPEQPSTSRDTNSSDNGQPTAVVPYFDRSYTSIYLQDSFTRSPPIGLSFTALLRDGLKEPIRLAERLFALEMYCNFDAGSLHLDDEEPCFTYAVSLADAVTNPMAAFYKTTRSPRSTLDYARIFHRSAVYYLDWVAACPEIHIMSPRDQLTLIGPKMSTMHFCTIAYNTFKYKVDGYLLPDGYVFETGKCWDPYVTSMIALLKSSVLPLMEKLRLSGQEFCILKQIIMYTGNIDLSEDGRTIVNAARKKYEQLLVFYVEEVYALLDTEEKLRRVRLLLELKNALVAGGLIEFEHVRKEIEASVRKNLCTVSPCLAYDMHFGKF